MMATLALNKLINGVDRLAPKIQTPIPPDATNPAEAGIGRQFLLLSCKLIHAATRLAAKK